MSNGYLPIQQDLQKSALSLKKKSKGKPAILTVALDVTQTAFTGDIQPGLGVIRNGEWSEKESSVIGHLVEFLGGIWPTIQWIMRQTRNKKGQSPVAIDEQSLARWNINKE